MFRKATNVLTASRAKTKAATIPINGAVLPYVSITVLPSLATESTVAAVSVMRPSRKLNSTAAARLMPRRTAATIVTRLRDVPGQRASAWAQPMKNAVLTVIDSSATPPLLRGLSRL